MRTHIVDLFSVGLVVPTIPYFAKALGASAQTQGILGTVYGILQLAGSPILGRLSDQLGRKWIMMVSIFGSFVSYFWMTQVTTLTGLFLSRIPIGLLKQTESTAYTMVTDLTDEKDRAKYLGYIQAAFGMGFIVGPAFSALITPYGLEYPAYIASTIFLIDLTLVYFAVPDNVPLHKIVLADDSVASLLKPPNSPLDTDVGLIDESTSSSIANGSSDGASTSVSATPPASASNPSSGWGLMASLGVHGLGRCMVVHFFAQFSMLLLQANFGLLMEEMGLNPRESGLIMAFMGIVSVVTSTVVVKYLTKNYPESVLISRSILALSISLFTFQFSSGMYSFMVLLVPYVMSARVLKTCVISRISAVRISFF
jgi:MFS family permease